jgi:hypothetical protein
LPIKTKVLAAALATTVAVVALLAVTQLVVLAVVLATQLEQHYILQSRILREMAASQFPTVAPTQLDKTSCGHGAIIQLETLEMEL